MLVNKFETENNVLEIMYDECADSPRSWDNLGTIVAWHSRYSLSEEDYSDYRAFLEENTYQYFETDEGLENASDERLMDLFKKDHIILPVYMYEHSGVVLNTHGFSCPWDSGQVGFIYVSKEKVRSEYGVKRITKKLLEKVEGVLASEIEVYSDYVDGNVYGYVLKDKEGNDVDSCWGFIGSDFKMNGMTSYLPSEFVELI